MYVCMFNILKVKDIYKLQILAFVNNCLMKRIPPLFYDYFPERASRYNIRRQGLNISYSRTVYGSLSVKTIGAGLWNNLPDPVKPHRYKLYFNKRVKVHLISEYQ